jgi:predicted nucleic acid-binding Zn finger protein
MLLLNEVKRAAKSGLGYKLYKSLLLNYGKRGEKAYFYLRDQRVKKYLDFFVVVGRSEYVVEDNFCTCPDFQINLRGKKPCSHIIAVEISKILKCYDEINAYYVDFLKDMDWRREI